MVEQSLNLRYLISPTSNNLRNKAKIITAKVVKHDIMPNTKRRIVIACDCIEVKEEGQYAKVYK